MGFSFLIIADFKTGRLFLYYLHGSHVIRSVLKSGGRRLREKLSQKKIHPGKKEKIEKKRSGTKEEGWLLEDGSRKKIHSPS